MERKQGIKYLSLAAVLALAILSTACSKDVVTTPLGNTQLHFAGVFDGDSTDLTGTPYNVADHFHFIVATASGDSISSVPVVNLPTVQWVLQSGQTQAPPTCSVATDVLILNCPASSGSGFTGYYLITVQQGSYDGITNPSYRGQFRLYVNASPTPPLSFIGKFDGDSISTVGASYDVAQHFHFVVADANSDSVTSVPVVNLPSVQWVLKSGQVPLTSPSCSVATNVLTLHCPASSGSGFTGYYLITVQQGGYDGISNPAYRPTFDLYVNPSH